MRTLPYHPRNHCALKRLQTAGKKQEPTVPTVFLPPPEAVLEDPDFKKTAKTIIKQLVSIRMVLDVTEYHADVYYNAKTGERVHAAFPDGVINDVNYDGSIRAFLFLLNNDCCVSIDKSRKFLSDLTGGKLNISKDMISRLSREFALKTEPERRAAYADMLFSPVMHTDCTNARENGKGCYVYVCATPDGKALYFARAKKRHEGVKGTVAEDYQGILVHDHDITFYSYGTEHQECLTHVLRYLKGSMDNEPGRAWNKEMHGLIQEMIHIRNETLLSCNLDPEKISGFEERYLKILETARKEYEDIPANAYYKDGYNLFLRMEKYMQNRFATPVLYKQCEENGTSYVIRLKENGILREKASYLVNELDEITRNNKVDYAVVYGEFMYKASSWAYERRVVCKVEKPENQMVYMYTFIVTNMDSSPEYLIKFYCKRGLMENFIKESKSGFDFASVSSHSRIVNANRLQVHALAYNIFNWFRRLALSANMRKQRIDTVRLKLLKIAAKVVHSARYITFKLCSSCPYKNEFYETFSNIGKLNVQLE